MQIDKKITFKEIITECVIPPLAVSAIAAFGLFLFDLIIGRVEPIYVYLLGTVFAAVFMWLLTGLFLLTEKKL